MENLSEMNRVPEERLERIGKYLKNKVKGKHIVDVNCGSAPLLNYIPHTFKSYYGNDISPELFFPNGILKSNRKNARMVHGNILLEYGDDEFLVEKLKGKKIDILLILGATVGHITPGHAESETQDVTLKRLVSIHKPKIIVLEIAQEYAYDTRFDLMHRYSTEWEGVYKRGAVVKMGTKEELPRNRRVFTTFERKHE